MSVHEPGKLVFRMNIAPSERDLFRYAVRTRLCNSGLRCFPSGPCLSWNWRASSLNLGLKPVVGWRNQCRSQISTRDWWLVPDLAILCGCPRFLMAQSKLRRYLILFAHTGFSGPGVTPFLANPHDAEAVVFLLCLARDLLLLFPQRYPGLFLSITMLRCFWGDPKEATLDPQP